MAGIITTKFRLKNTKKFIESIANEKLYTFIGRPYSWTDDLSPPAPTDNIKNENTIWDGITSLKRVGTSDVSHGIYKRVWTAGKYYDMYRHDWDGTKTGENIDTGANTTPLSLADSNYYVVTENNNIYICLSNNNGAQSTINPQSLGTGGAQFLPVAGGDQYIWKFVGNTGSAEATKFQSTYYHPVKTLDESPEIGDPYLDQWNAQQIAKTTYPGAIFVIEVTNGGTGYSQASPPGVTIDGDGTGASVTAVVGSAGQVVGLMINSYGTGYTWAKIVIDPPTSGTTASANALLTPIDGLGSDPVRDLSAHFAIINSTFVEDEGSGDFPTVNDYRQIGLIVNPIAYGTSNVLSLTTASACIGLKLASGYSGSFSPDSIITDSVTGAKGRIVDSTISGSNMIIRLIRTEVENSSVTGIADESFVVGNGVATSTGNSGSILEILNATNGGQEVTKYTGDIIYFENRRAIQRSPDQTEVVIMTFEF